MSGFGQLTGKSTQELIDELKILWLPELDRGYKGACAANFGPSSGVPVSSSFSALTEPLFVGGGNMRFAITPDRNIWWRIYYHVIAQNLAASWNRCDSWVELLNGVGSEQKLDAQDKGGGAHGCLMGHNALSFSSVHMHGLFKLVKGESYTCRPLLYPIDGTVWNYWLSRSDTHTGTGGNNYSAGFQEIAGYW